MATPQEQVVAYVKSQVGYYATAAKRNKYAQYLDALGYVYNGAKNGYDWCDVFADHAYIHCFGAETALKMINQPKYGCGAGCPWSADYYRMAGQWSDSPSLGAQIFFGVPGDECHTGIVVAYDDTYVYTVEGNVGGGGGMVGARTHVRGQGIAGYGIPKWSLAGGSGKPSSPIVYKGYLLDGEFGYYTKLELQKYLRKKQYYKGYLLDGEFGYYSVLGLQKYLRKLGYYTKDYLLDGEWGKYTTMALQNALNDGKF